MIKHLHDSHLYVFRMQQVKNRIIVSSYNIITILLLEGILLLRVPLTYVGVAYTCRVVSTARLKLIHERIYKLFDLLNLHNLLRQIHIPPHCIHLPHNLHSQSSIIQ